MKSYAPLLYTARQKAEFDAGRLAGYRAWYGASNGDCPAGHTAEYARGWTLGLHHAEDDSCGF